MIISNKKISILSLIKYLNNQLSFFGIKIAKDESKIVLHALLRYFSCISVSRNENYNNKLDTLHSCQYSIFLYYLSNEFFYQKKIKIADGVYYLNKMLNGVDLFYRSNLPNHFGIEHPVSTVVGRSSLGDFLFLYQNCTIGVSLGNMPCIGNYVVLCANSSVLGSSTIGNFVIISSGTCLINKKIPDYSIVFSDGTIKSYSNNKKALIEKIMILSDFKMEDLL